MGEQLSIQEVDEIIGAEVATSYRPTEADVYRDAELEADRITRALSMGQGVLELTSV